MRAVSGAVDEASASDPGFLTTRVRSGDDENIILLSCFQKRGVERKPDSKGLRLALQRKHEACGVDNAG